MPRGVKGSGAIDKSEEWVPFGLRFRDKSLRKEIKTESLQLEVDMSEYIVAILKRRKKILPLTIAEIKS